MYLMEVPIISPHPPQHRRGLENATVEELRAQGFSYRAIAEQLGSNHSAVYRLLNQSTPDSAPSGEPGSPRLDDIEQRLSVVEVFTATLQRQPLPLNGSPHGSPPVNRSPTHKRGFVLADDLFHAIHAFAKTEQIQVKQVLDLALREFFARRSWPPAEGSDR